MIGAGLIVFTRDWLSGPWPGHGPLLLGVLFLIAVYTLPGGLVGLTAGGPRAAWRALSRAIRPADEPEKAEKARSRRSEKAGEGGEAEKAEKAEPIRTRHPNRPPCPIRTRCSPSPV